MNKNVADLKDKNILIYGCWTPFNFIIAVETYLAAVSDVAVVFAEC